MKDVEKRISLNGSFVVVILLVLYGLSRLFPATWQVYTADFSGTLVAIVVALLVSMIWLALYWSLDRLQHESLSMVAGTFLWSVAAYIAVAEAATWITGGDEGGILRDILLPSLVFYLIFTRYVIHLTSFDEMVDSFIYGGFAGTGIAFASCMMDFVQYETMSVQFMLLELITKISVHAAVCSLTGFLLHQGMLTGRKVLEVIPVGSLLILFAVETWVERQLGKNLAYASVDLVSVIISLCFVVLVVALVVLLIHRTLKVEENGEQEKFRRVKAFSYILFVFAAIVLCDALYVRFSHHGTASFMDAQYSFHLPKGFEKKEIVSGGSIFAMGTQDTETYYENVPFKLYADFSPKLSFSQGENEVAFSPVKGWSISEQQGQYVDKNSSGIPSVHYQYSYHFTREGQNVLVDVYTPIKDDSAVQNIIRIFARSLEENK